MDTEILHKYLSGTCTEQQRREVENWLQESLENQEKMNELKQVWEVSPGKKIHVDSHQAWDTFSDRHMYNSKKSGNTASNKSRVFKNTFEYPTKQKKTARVVAFTLAAAAVLLIAFLFYNSNPIPSEQSESELVNQEITTERGQRTTVRLSDGTRIHLNAESKLVVPQDYMQNDRIVRLHGEAFFEVTSNKDKPFVVQTDRSITRVLGTKFNVTAYPDQKEVQVVVDEGRVVLGSEKDVQAPEVQLTRSQRGTINGNGEIIASHVSDVGRYLDWSRGKLTFQDAPLEDVEKRLERWYDIEVIFDKGISTENRRLTGSFKDISMTNVLNSIALSLELNYKEEGRKITFMVR